MFEIGDLIVYGNSGVCRVEKIGAPELSSYDKDKDYYTLVPYYQPTSRIFTPCDNEKVVMRRIISEKEAESLIDEIDSIDLLTITDEKQREAIYKDVIKSCDCRTFVSIIKTIYCRKQARLAEGKKITASDEKYFNLAEDKLYGELAVVLGKKKSEIRVYIASKVKENN